MWLRSTYELKFEIYQPALFILMLRPQSGKQQWIVSEEYRINPNVTVTEFTDMYGNLCQKLIAPAGNFSIRTTAEVQVQNANIPDHQNSYIKVSKLPFNVLTYLLPSRYCESDRFFNMAATITNGYEPGLAQVEAIETWIRERIQYVPGISNIPISAVDVNQRQAGVCRDLAHLGIALCRAISIPARIVVGFLHELEPMDFHAWFEAYIGGVWCRFDATQQRRKEGYIAVAYGRDAADVAVYNQFGPAVLPVSQFVEVEKIETDPQK